MILGRLFGWLLVAVALLLASGEAVMALGLGDDAAGIATGEVVTLLSGYEVPEPPTIRQPAVWALGLVLQMPAWAVIGPAGILLCWTFRRRPKRFRFRDS